LPRALIFLKSHINIQIKRKAILDVDPVAVEIVTEVRRKEALLKAGALQKAIFNSANFSSIATDAKGVIQIFNVGAERMLGCWPARTTPRASRLKQSRRNSITRARSSNLTLTQS
jgi:sensor histidine kinase regulating citrate/malate metabolism